MRRLTWMVCVGVVAMTVVVPRAQVPDAPQPGPINPDDWPTFKAGTRLATIDAVVVDDQGRQVTDLKPSDFEIVERGATPKVHQALYVRVGVRDGAPAMPPPPAASRAAPTRARPLATGAIAATGRVSTAANPRVLAIVVDDLGLSFESTAYVRQDADAATSTRRSSPAISSRSSAPPAASARCSSSRPTGGCSPRPSIACAGRSRAAAASPPSPPSCPTRARRRSRSGPFGRPSRRRRSGVDIERLRTDLAAAGSLGALEYVLRGIEDLPGRKSVVFVSEGMDLGIRDHKASRVWNTFTRVMDRANRAGVVVYTVDARGLQTGLMTGDDDPQTPKVSSGRGSNSGFAEINAVIQKGRTNRTRELIDTQESLVYMAQQTGGFAVLNTNDLGSGLGRIVDDTRGYYLIGFETLIPTGEAWDPERRPRPRQAARPNGARPAWPLRSRRLQAAA